MLKETWKANLAKARLENPSALFIEVTRSAGHPLSPSWTLLKLYKEGRISWDGYVQEFTEQMKYFRCIEAMREIAELAKTRDVFLVCYEPPGQNCHRHLLINMIRIKFGEHPDTSPPLKV